MFDLPLHPAVVHLPIGIGILAPIVALFILIGIRMTWFKPNTWAIMVLIQFIFVISSVVAVSTGETDEHTIEKVISEQLIEEHEELSEKVPWIGGVIFLIALLGHVKKQPVSRAAQVLTLVALLASVGVLLKVGHSGGELVYKHNAASVYMEP